MNATALQAWARLQKLNDLEHKVNAAILGEKEPPYELRNLHTKVKEELAHATNQWHQHMSRS